jgi:hypothetical protein
MSRGFKVPDIDGAPEHIANNPGLVFDLRRVGNFMADYYRAPVYLVGSALRKADPRDWDIRVILSDDEFTRRFGDVKEWESQHIAGSYGKIGWLVSEENHKKSRELQKQMHGKFVDFKVLPESYFNSRWKEELGHPKLRIDTMDQEWEWEKEVIADATSRGIT